jgi:hypothetical protein
MISSILFFEELTNWIVPKPMHSLIYLFFSGAKYTCTRTQICIHTWRQNHVLLHSAHTRCTHAGGLASLGIEVAPESRSQYPRSRTCSNLMWLPNYASKVTALGATSICTVMHTACIDALAFSRLRTKRMLAGSETHFSVVCLMRAL